TSAAIRTPISSARPICSRTLKTSVCVTRYDGARFTTTRRPAFYPRNSTPDGGQPRHAACLGAALRTAPAATHFQGPPPVLRRTHRTDSSGTCATGARRGYQPGQAAAARPAARTDARLQPVGRTAAAVAEPYRAAQ